MLTALAICLQGAACAEPLPRRESNVSVRNEVQLAIDKGLAHLQSTQRADGTWGKIGTTGFVLMALWAEPGGRGRLGENRGLAEPGALWSAVEKGYGALERAFPKDGDLQKMEDFERNVPPALVALRGRQVHTVVDRALPSLAAAPLPPAPETRAFFLFVDPKNRSAGEMPAPRTGSALCAWLMSFLFGDLDSSRPHRSPLAPKARDLVVAWLGEHYTLERNPEGEGVHQYYYWLSQILGRPAAGFLDANLKLASGGTVDVARELAEKLINEQNGNGSWSGVGDHWTEKDPDLVTAMCILTLEKVYAEL
jgi:hypothetical protein